MYQVPPPCSNTEELIDPVPYTPVPNQLTSVPLPVQDVWVVELSLKAQEVPLELVGKFKYLPVPSVHD